MNQLSYTSPNQFYVIKKKKKNAGLSKDNHLSYRKTSEHCESSAKGHQFENWNPATPIMEYGQWTQAVVFDIVSASGRLRLHLGVVSMSR